MGLVTVGFGQDGLGVAMPKGDFRARILGGERGEALLGRIMLEAVGDGKLPPDAGSIAASGAGSVVDPGVIGNSATSCLSS